MKKCKFIIGSLFLVFGCLSCTNNGSIAQEVTDQLKKKLIGSWGGVYDSKSYVELHFVNDSIYVPIQDSVFFHFNHFYSWIGEDTIRFQTSGFKYKVSLNKDTLTLSMKNKKYKYEKLKPEILSLTDEFFEGFVLRRCYFLTSKGIISIYEAYEYLYKYIEDYNILDTTRLNIEDEYIPMKITQ